jgi:hypothetical protein
MKDLTRRGRKVETHQLREACSECKQLAARKVAKTNGSEIHSNAIR